MKKTSTFLCWSIGALSRRLLFMLVGEMVTRTLTRIERDFVGAEKSMRMERLARAPLGELAVRTMNPFCTLRARAVPYRTLTLARSSRFRTLPCFAPLVVTTILTNGTRTYTCIFLTHSTLLKEYD